MGLGQRNARRHDTVGIRRHAVVSEDYWDFRPQQHVMTLDGFPGIVAAVLDGPHPGSEVYEVVLDRGLGGGHYSSGQLRPLEHVTASEGTAAVDYPELSGVLESHPDPAAKV